MGGSDPLVRTECGASAFSFVFSVDHTDNSNRHACTPKIAGAKPQACRQCYSPFTSATTSTTAPPQLSITQAQAIGGERLRNNPG